MKRRRAPITLNALGFETVGEDGLTPSQRYAASQTGKEYEQMTFAEQYAASHPDVPSQHEILTESLRRGQILMEGYGGRIPQHGEPIRRIYYEVILSPSLDMGRYDGEGNYIPPVPRDLTFPRLMLALLDKYGAKSTAELPEEIRAQLPHQGLHYYPPSQSVFEQAVDLVTSAPFLLAAGPIAAMLAAPAAGAGAAASTASEGALASELTAAEWSAGLSAEQIGGGALAEAAASGALTAAEWESVAAGWEGLAAESSLQNVALAEIAGDVAAGTLADMIGSEAAAEMLAQGAAVLGPESAVASTWYQEAGQAVVNKLVQMGKAQVAAELQRQFLGSGEPQSAGTATGGSGGDYYGYEYGAGGDVLDLEGDAGLQSGFISGTMKKAAVPLTIGAGLAMLALFALPAMSDERD